MEDKFCYFQVSSLILVLPIILHLCNFAVLYVMSRIGIHIWFRSEVISIFVETHQHDSNEI